MRKGSRCPRAAAPPGANITPNTLGREPSLPGRREPRFASNLVVRLETGDATARNVSASGIYFQTRMPVKSGTALRFTVHFVPHEGAPLLMHCRARVVRVEVIEGGFGVGAAIQHFTLERPARGNERA